MNHFPYEKHRIIIKTVTIRRGHIGKIYSDEKCNIELCEG